MSFVNSKVFKENFEKENIYNILIKLHLIDFRDLIIPFSNTIQETNDQYILWDRKMK